MAHTPGPWSVGRSADNTPAICVPCPQWSGFAVAIVNRLPKLGIVAGDAEDNARLIAAAPTMFDYIARRAALGDAEAQLLMEAQNADS